MAQNQIHFDVIIAGAGTGGIGAAIQAARMGSSVLLLEETDWVGGQLTAAGVTSTDVGTQFGIASIYNEFATKVTSYYQSLGKPAGKCYFSNQSICPEPFVAHNIFQEMISNEPNITLQLNTSVTSVLQSNNNINGVTLNNGQTILTTMLVDTTEYGDIIPLTGSDYRLANTTNTAVTTSNRCIQDITYLAVIKEYPQGVPNSLRISTPPPGYTTQIQQRFAQFVSNSGNYPYTGQLPVTWEAHNQYRGMPDSFQTDTNKITKTGVNWANDYPISDSFSYFNDPNYRKQINCEAKLRTIQFLYYAQHDLGKSNWSVSTDEQYNTTYNRANSCTNIPASLKDIEYNLPLIPYVRESRRIIGPFTLTAKDIKRTGNPSTALTFFPSSIAIGDYFNDLHGCGTDADLETSLETSADVSSAGVFQIPIETLYSNTINGFIAGEKNISQTRLTNGATRLQPVTMLTGQAVGALASLAAKYRLSPKDVPTLAVQSALLSSKAPLIVYSDVSPVHPNFIPIEKMGIRQIMNGYGNLLFKPDVNVTRRDSAIILSKSFHIPTTNPSSPTFVDVPHTDYGYNYIEGIYNAGLTSGCIANPKSYCPDNPITKEQLAILALKGWTTVNPLIQPFQPQTATYSDVTPATLGYTFIEGLAKNGIIWYCNPSTKTFCPETIATRSQTALFLDNILNQISPNSVQFPADATNDGVIDGRDYSIWTTSFNQPLSGNILGDFDFNTMVNSIDYQIWKMYYTK